MTRRSQQLPSRAGMHGEASDAPVALTESQEAAPAPPEQTNASGEGWTLWRGDCLAGLRTLADKSVDVTITDPPYSRDLYARTRTNKGSGVRATGRPYSRTELDASIALGNLRIGAIDDILEVVAAEILRVTKRWIVVFSDVEILDRWRTQFGSDYVRTGVWVKTDPMPQITGDRPAQGFEPATIAHPRGRKHWNGGGRPATWICGTSKGIERPDHPSPKPVALMEQLVADFSDPGELVLDPFAGSGTTGLACRSLGRRFLGWELDPEFHALAAARIGGQELHPRPEQPGLFDALRASHDAPAESTRFVGGIEHEFAGSYQR